ncbi:MAG: hypothetical protein ABI859_13950 [Pseudomonadota bacterium]
MKPDWNRVAVSAAMLSLALLLLSGPANADPPIWANARWVMVTDTVCGGAHTLVLRPESVKAPPPSKAPGCTTTEEKFHQINVAKTFFWREKNGQIAASDVEAIYIYCGKGEVAMHLGSTGMAVRAWREFQIPGCTGTKRRYQAIASVGNIKFTDVPNPGTMSVAESLAMHAKERQKIIADCNANPICRAQVERMRASSGSGTPSNPCIASSNYSQYNGAGRCTDSNGNPDPKGTYVPAP